MKRILALLLSLVLLCSMGTMSAVADGEMTYTLMYASEVSTLNYLTCSTQWDQRVGANVIDSLVEYDSVGKIKPALAETWLTSEDGLTWTFNLRKGVKWYDHTGAEVAEVTANDFVAAAKYVMTPEYESGTFNQMTFIKNANAYFDGTVTDFAEVGVKAIDDYTLEYTLEAPVPYFLSCLTYVCYLPAYGPLLEELGKDFGTANDKMYYCGAFILETFEPQVTHEYVKNANNWDAENILIDRIVRLYNSESLTLSPTMALRGEVDYAEISTDILDDWQENHADVLSRDRVIPDYSYFYTFNFDPQYDESYGPENWLIAVNNASFRHSIMSAFDRNYAMAALEVDADARAQVTQNTVCPATFTGVDGKDFTTYEAFDGIADNFFNADKALEYKATAIEELTAAGATFPVKMVMTYRSDDKDWENEYIMLKQQIEGVLGTDYIECILYPGAADNFLTATRRAGVYSFMRCNWGADYQDPQTWTDPFAVSYDSETGAIKGNSYNKMDLMLDSEFTQTKDIMVAYYEKVEEAIASVTDMDVRYTKFAEAEAMLINNAIVVPYYIRPAIYQATKLNIFESGYASFGMSTLRFKGQKVYDHFISPEEYATNHAAWLAEVNK